MISYRKYIYPFIYTLCIAMVGIFFLGMQYTAGDDIAMQSMLNGSLTNGELNVYSVFNNIVFSSVIGYLYYIFPALEWYSLTLLVLVLVSVYVIAYILINYQRNIWGGILLVILSFSVWFLAKFQFTCVTGLVALAGYFLFVNAKGNNVKVALSIVLLFIASIIRFEMFVLVSICILPHIVMEDFSLRKIYPFGVLFLMIVGALGLHYYCYHLGDWAYFTEFNEWRGKLNDNGNVTSENLSMVLNKEDIVLFQRVIFTEIIDIPMMKKMWIYTKGSMGNNEYFIIIIKKYVLSVVLCVFLALGNLFSKKYYLALFPFIFWGLVYYISMNHIPKERIIYPTIFAYTVFSFYYFTFRYSWIWALGVISFVFYKHIRLYSQHQITPINEGIYREMKQNEDIVYIPFPASSNDIFSLQPFEERLPKNIIMSGWLTNAPVLKERKDIHYTQNIMNIRPREGKSIVYVISKEELEYLNEILGKDTFKVVKELNGYYFLEKKR